MHGLTYTALHAKLAWTCRPVAMSGPGCQKSAGSVQDPAIAVLQHEDGGPTYAGLAKDLAA